ncbi:MAG: hypothetical protein HRU20_02830 [Pseudomonadales bacterium]|nr:hypothetical protein [Pseudomonadales bacterium]
MPNSFYKWDKYSDQPQILRDKAFKKGLYKRGAAGSIKTLLSILLLPFLGLRLLFQPRTLIGTATDNIGLCINPDYPIDEKFCPTDVQLKDMVHELGVEDLLIRLPLADFQHKQKYFDFIDLFSDKKILINILQDRNHIENPAQTKLALTEIFERYSNTGHTFQIGNTVNRRKWAFISQDEYFQFFKIAQDLKESLFPQITLLGGNIIDFELPFFIRSVFHLWPIKYDGVAAQLYVDRRGAPENTQLACDTLAKINWFSAIMQCSRRTTNRLFITEVNWPLEDTRPYAPAYGDCMVSEDLQATYLVRYYLMMMASGKVEKCYWHQLVAPGYGLVDNRGTGLRKRDAYTSFKVLNHLFKDAKTCDYSEQNQQYCLHLESPKGTFKAYWGCDKSFCVKVEPGEQAIDLLGNKITPDKQGFVKAGDRVIYILNFNYSSGK